MRKLTQTLLILAISIWAMPAVKAEQQRNIFAMSEGTVVVSCSSQDYSVMWSPLNAFDSDPQRGWSTAKGKIQNENIVIELPQKYKMQQIIIDNENAQDDSLCAKTVEIWGSVLEEEGGFKKIATIKANKMARTKVSLPDQPVLRRLKFVVADNWGDDKQAQIMEIEGFGEPQGKADFSNTIWDGTFSSDLGALKIKQNGIIINGCFEKNSGTLYGALSGNIMRFEWRKDGKGNFGSGVMVLNASGKEANGTCFKNGNVESLWLSKKNNMIPCYCKFPEGNSILHRLKETKRAVLFGIDFDDKTARLKPESDAALNELLDALKDNTMRIQIEGYSDASGTVAAGVRFSQNRAQSVADWLKNHKIDAARIKVKGFGDANPIGDNSMPQGRFLNNRIEVTSL